MTLLLHPRFRRRRELGIIDGKLALTKFSKLSTLFDGVDEDILIANDSSFDFTTDFSVAYWVKGGVSVSSGDNLIVKRFASAGLAWFTAAVFPDGGVRIILDSGGTTLKDYRTLGFDFFDGVWHLFVLTWSSSTLLAYGDGSLLSTSKIADNPGASIDVTTAPIRIGSRAGLISFFPGNIDEVSIWKRGLSAAEVIELHNGGAPADPTTHSAAADLVSPYGMGDNDTFPVVADNVGSNDGTMNNMEAGDFVADTPP